MSKRGKEYESGIAVIETSVISLSEAVAEPETPTSSWKRFNFCWLACGGAEVLYWNALINSMNDVVDVYYPEYPKLCDTVSIAVTATNFVAGVVATKRGFVNTKLSLWMCVVSVIIPLVTPLILYMPSHVGANVLMHVMGGLDGIVIGFWQAGHFGLASYMPIDATSWVASGTGIAGITTFLLHMLLSEAIFPDRSNVLGVLWGLHTTIAVITAAAMYATWYTVKHPKLTHLFVTARESVAKGRLNPNRPRLRSMIIEFWPSLLACIVNACVSYWIYPNIGPFRWSRSSPSVTNMIIGGYQLGDFVGSAMPALASIAPWVMWSPKKIYWGAGLRVLFLIPALVMWQFNESFIWDHTWWQVLFMAVLGWTNGWVNSLTLILGPTTCAGPEKRGAVAAIGVLALLFGVALGLIFTKALVFAVEGEF